MSTQIEESLHVQADARNPIVCDVVLPHNCTKPATVALSFDGCHIHDCAPHAAHTREWNAVVSSAPIINGRCPWPCTGIIRTGPLPTLEDRS